MHKANLPIICEAAASRLCKLQGALASAIGDALLGKCLHGEGQEILNIPLASAYMERILKAKRKAMGTLGIQDEIEDILITLGTQHHLIRPIPGGNLFIYLALDRNSANLGMARHALAQTAQELS